MAEDIEKEYLSSLVDLSCNSKPLINMLTVLADENVSFAPVIVQTIEKHLTKTDFKLPCLYLVDSILKNVGKVYVQLFTQNIVSTFAGVFEKVDEKTRAAMFRLRQTWSSVFPPRKLYAIDLRVNGIDPAWPVVPPPTEKNTIHINPKVFKKGTAPVLPGVTAPAAAPSSDLIVEKQMELLALQIQTVELQLQCAASHSDKMQKQKELLDLRTQKAQLELQQATSKLKTKAAVPTTTSGAPAAAQSKTIHPAKVASAAPSDPRSAARAEPTDPRSGARPDGDPRTKRADADPRSAARADADPRSAAVSDPRTELRADPRTHSRDLAKSAARHSSPRPQPGRDPAKSSSGGGDPRDPRLQRLAAATATSPTEGREALLQTPPAPPPPPVIRNTGAPPRPAPATSTTSSRSGQRVTSDRKSSGDRKRGDKQDRDDRSTTDNKSRSSKDSNSEKTSKLDHDDRSASEGKSKTSKDSSSDQSKHDHSSKSSKSSSSSSRSKDTAAAKSALSSSSSKLSPGTGQPKEKQRSSPKLSSKNTSPTKPKSVTDSPRQKASSPPKHKPADSPKRKHIDESPRRSRLTDSPKRRHVEPTIDSPRLPALPQTSPLHDDDDDPMTSPVSSGAEDDTENAPPSPAVFRRAKHSRTRKYKQHSRWSTSPERTAPSDVDLRIGKPEQTVVSAPTPAAVSTPASPPPKRRRTSEGEESTNDVDLRHHTPQATGEDATDRSKPNNSLDDLFGSEDTDLRFVEPSSGGTAGWRQLKESRPETFKSPLRARAAQHQPGVDTDLRVSAGAGGGAAPARSPLLPRPQPRVDLDSELRALDESNEATQKNIQMILQQAEEQLRAENITWEQYNNILQQVIQLGERQKIQELRSLERRKSMTERSRRDSMSSAASSVTDADERELRGRPDDRDIRGRPDDRELRGRPDDRELRGRPDPNERDLLLRPPNHHRGDDWEEMGRGGWRRDEPPQRPLLPLPGLPPGVPHRGPPAYPDEYRDRDREPHRGGYGGPRYGGAPGRGARLPPPPQPPHGRGAPPPPAPYEDERALTYRGRGGRGRGMRGPPIGATPRPAQPQSRYEEFEPTHEPDLPDASADDLAAVERDKADHTSTFINEEPKEIRWYGENCICLLEWDDPRMLYFKPGMRDILIDGQRVPCRFNDKYTDIMIDGVQHSIRLGGPTKEVFLDGHGYQVYFGGEPVQVPVDGRQRALSVEGPAPGVEIGRRRTDLLAGKIRLVVDGGEQVPIFLDCKPQRFDVAGKPHVLRFRDGFQRMCLNGQLFYTEFGGLPLSIVVGGRKHYIRLTKVPVRVRPGRMNMKGMPPNSGVWPQPWIEFKDPLGGHQERPEEEQELPAPPVAPPPPPQPPRSAADEPAPFRGGRGRGGRGRGHGRGGRHPNRDEPPKDDSPRHQPQSSALDMLANIMPMTVSKPSGPSYHAENPGHALAPGAAGVDLNDLLSKLQKTGLIKSLEGGAASKDNKGNRKEEEIKNIKQIDWKIDSLRVRQPGIINLLYSGIQCSSCGSRFLPEQTVQYSNHLDWHFRQNRREKEGTRRAQSRKWYYDLSSWMLYEEVEDADDRVEPAFDQPEAGEAEPEEDMESMCSAPVGPTEADNKCQVCGETLRQFYHEESEEWHLRDCIRVEGKAYHPSCFEDHKTTLLLQSLRQESTDNDTSMETSAADLTSPVDEDVAMETGDAKPAPDYVPEAKSEVKTEKVEGGDDLGAGEFGKHNVGDVKDEKSEEVKMDTMSGDVDADKAGAQTSHVTGAPSEVAGVPPEASDDVEDARGATPVSDEPLTDVHADEDHAPSPVPTEAVESDSAGVLIPLEDIKTEVVDPDMSDAGVADFTGDVDNVVVKVEQASTELDSAAPESEPEGDATLAAAETAAFEAPETVEAVVSDEDAPMKDAESERTVVTADVEPQVDSGFVDPGSSQSEPTPGEDVADRADTPERAGADAEALDRITGVAAAQPDDAVDKFTNPPAPSTQPEPVVEAVPERLREKTASSPPPEAPVLPTPRRSLRVRARDSQERGSKPERAVTPPQSGTAREGRAARRRASADAAPSVVSETEAVASTLAAASTGPSAGTSTPSPATNLASTRADTSSPVPDVASARVADSAPALTSAAPVPSVPVLEPQPAAVQELTDVSSDTPEARAIVPGKIKLRLAGMVAEEPQSPVFSERPQPASVKPALIGRQLTEQPMKHAGEDEESGMCVIM